jgi:hypothetical protein
MYALVRIRQCIYAHQRIHLCVWTRSQAGRFCVWTRPQAGCLQTRILGKGAMDHSLLSFPTIMLCDKLDLNWQVTRSRYGMIKHFSGINISKSRTHISISRKMYLNTVFKNIE